MRKKLNAPTQPSLPTQDKSLLMARLLYEKQGENVLVLDVTGICPITEHLVLVTARGQRHAQALADILLQLAGERKFVSLGVEGYQAGAWVLLDFNDVVVHVFQEDQRLFYNIEGLWSEGQRLDWSAAGPEGR